MTSGKHHTSSAAQSNSVTMAQTHVYSFRLTERWQNIKLFQVSFQIPVTIKTFVIEADRPLLVRSL